jgi:hypothetical protein
MLGDMEDYVMAEKTCAACDCKLEGDVITVSIAGKSVEVCCEECATSLREAHSSAIQSAKAGAQAKL